MNKKELVSEEMLGHLELLAGKWNDCEIFLQRFDPLNPADAETALKTLAYQQNIEIEQEEIWKRFSPEQKDYVNKWYEENF
jgi:hypothetical protein